MKRLRTIALCTLALAASFGRAQVLRLGAMGDSLTDEYAEESYSYARNWLEQLRLYRAIDLGPSAQQAGMPGGTWGEPRRKFYKYDWARAGASTIAVLAGGQASGLAAQHATDGVDHAVLLVGSNDFAPGSTAFTNLYNNTWTQSQIDAYVASRLSNMATIIDTASAPGISLAVSTFLDYSIALSARKQYPDPIKRQRITVVVKRVNQGIRSLCRTRGLVLVDVYGIFSAIFGTNDAIHDTLLMGGQTIALNTADTSSNTNPLAGLCHDGVHPHTTLQGVFANYFIAAMNTAWHAGLEPFSEAEILAHAGVAYGGVDQVPAQLGPYQNLVTNYACLADFDRSGFVDLDDFTAFTDAFLRVQAAADFDENGQVTPQDFSDFVTAFEQGC